ncbi:hypothetical protein EW145_g2684 [Phellinidium pouzarii]|uniref:HIT domain-containing protein n=1 Tax=Phellinidium pouzarii TaxID=167371 RepID=A0A4S4LBW5_9AGAM|nr:hypothetical protein EW145_g2684 [Phellinidium pouzarii]
MRLQSSTSSPSFPVVRRISFIEIQLWTESDISSSDVLVVPTRVVPRLTDLSSPEVAALFTSVQQVGRVVERAFGADALTIACQDGKAAGQSVPHVHVHILPRKLAGRGDLFEHNNDDIYPALEDAEAALPRDLRSANLQANKLKVDADDARPPRTVEDMVREAEWLKGIFDAEKGEVGP